MSGLKSRAELPEDPAGTPADPAGRSAEELAFWIDCIGAPVLVVERHGPRIRFANATAEATFFMDREAICRSTLAEVLGAEADALLGQVWSSPRIGSVGEPFVIRAVVADQNRMLMVRVTKILVEGETLRLMTLADAPPQGSVALAGWQDSMMDILNWFPFGFEIADNADQIHFVNAHCKKLFGYEPHELENAEDWWALAYPDAGYREFARRKWESELAAARANGSEIMPFDLDVTTASGAVRTIQFRHRTIGAFNVNLYIDVTRERAYERELKRLAGTDPLTGAMNRRSFFEEAAIAHDAGAPPSAFLMIDIDHFKSINDAHGHGAGDQVLKEVTRRCLGVLRPGDRFARFGGEEFAVLLVDTSMAAASRVAERLRSTIADEAFSVSEPGLKVTASIGLASYSARDEIDGAISRADKALYEAKRLGRDRVVVSTREPMRRNRRVRT